MMLVMHALSRSVLSYIGGAQGETVAGRRSLQSAQEKDHRQGNLPSQGQMHTPNHRQRKTEDGDIDERQREHGDHDEDPGTHAPAWNVRVPGLTERSARQK